jgi:hypothetical protein
VCLFPADRADPAIAAGRENTRGRGALGVGEDPSEKRYRTFVELQTRPSATYQRPVELRGGASRENAPGTPRPFPCGPPPDPQRVDPIHPQQRFARS